MKTCAALLGILLVQQGPPTAEIERLIRLLGDDEQHVREEATRKLIALGEDAVPLVEKVREDKDAEVASRARRILATIYRPLDELPEKARAKLKVVEERIADLRKAGRERDATALEAALRETRRLILSGKPAPAEGPEVHAVGLYEARGAGNAATVRVTTTDRPVILVVCAYEKVSWTVDVGPNVTLERVIAGGYHAQEVIGLPKDTPLIKKVHDEGSSEDFFKSHGPEDDGYPDMVRKVRTLAGRPMGTFQGAYRYPGHPFVVGPESAAWRNQRLTPLVDRLYEEATREAREALVVEMRTVRFTAVNLSTDRFGLAGGPFGEFTPLGPVGKTLKPVKVRAIAVDPIRMKTYALTVHEVLEIDPASGDSKEITPTELPEMSWPQAAAFDTKRNRLLVTNAAGATGHLWAYDPAKGEWSVLADMKDPHLTGLAYSAADDVLYGVGADRRKPGHFSLIYRFNPQGALLDPVRLSEPVRAGGEGRQCAQVVSIDKDRLVLLVGPLTNPDEGPEFVNRAYVVNPRTGEILFACVQKPE